MPNAAAATSAARARRRRTTQDQERRAVIPISAHFASSSATTLVFKDAEGDASRMVVTNASGNLVFEVETKLATMSDRHVVKDANGKEIGQVRMRRTPNVHKTTYMGPIGDEKKIAIKLKGTTNSARTLSAAEFAADICMGSATVGAVGGNWIDKKVGIVMFGSRIAQFSKEAAGLVLDPGSYCAHVAPNVDTAFITMVVIALDEIYPE